MYLLLIKRHVNSQDDLQTYARVYVVAVEALTRNGLSNATVSQLAELNTACLWRNQALSNRLQYARHFTAVVKQELISAGASYAKISNKVLYDMIHPNFKFSGPGLPGLLLVLINYIQT